MASLLIARGADVLAQNSHGSTALHFACLKGAFGRDIVSSLIVAGADVTAREASGYTAFELALMQSKAMAEDLVPFCQLDSGRISARDPRGKLYVLC
jgi:ankyrin repeat protein